MSTAAGQGARRGASAEELRHLLRHRAVGAALLAGEGLEIGALHYPLPLNGGGSCAFLDVEDAATLRRRFPELADDAVVAADWIGDVGCATVPALTGRRFDFIVMNHVLEHVANPIQVVANVWDGLVEGGLLALSVPDKRFTFDRARRLTSFEHLLADFHQAVTTVDRSHYVELLEALRPDVFEDAGRFEAALAEAAARREHAHVWDSDSFAAFWRRAASLLGLDATVVYESTGQSNRFEYFAVVRNGAGRPAGEEAAFGLLGAVYRARGDLQQAFPAADPALGRRLLRWATTAGATIDSDAPVLRTYQDHFRRALGDGAARVEERVRAALIG